MTWTLKLYNPCYRAKPFDLALEGDDLDELLKLLAEATQNLTLLAEVLDKNAR